MKQGHIYIYGQVESYQSKEADDFGVVSLTTVKKQVEAQSDSESFIVHINSPGGEVYEGFAIHDYLRSLGKPITTRIEGLCASIATVISLSGDTRVMTENSDFMIHNPWGMAGGERKDIQKYADELERIEEKLIKFYEAKTNLKEKEIREYMDAETFITPDDALSYGFITEVAVVMKAVAMFNKKNNNKKPKKMSELSKKDKSWIKNLIESFTNKINPPKDLTLQDANGTSIVFPDVEEGQEVAIGDKATVDGEDANGEYTMTDGSVYVFASGELTAINEAEEEEEEEDNSEEVAELQETIDGLETQLKAEKKKNKKLVKEFDEFKTKISSRFNLDSKSNPKQNNPKKSKKSDKGEKRSLLKD